MAESKFPQLITIENSLQTNAQILDSSHWGEDFSWEQLQSISHYFKPYSASKGMVIYKEGEIGTSMGIIVKGAIGVYKNDKLISTLRVGRTFGEMSVIDAQPRSATARAEEETVFLALDKASMLILADKHPTLAFKIVWNISRALSQRLRLTSAQLAEFLESNII
ncbi:cyclic nucleotide-binding domain-containing protein [Methylobacter sp.]|uniref:Crp/Fnr family transcriptional regulator n=1 Tax=Methylobacter sp. TaxID=2051955 RepID=UPI00120D062E|nr:cyclic nucleotide-binding domain-containing protein [Methylobacter sp.]TAK63209.1 MAG: cyclic nucleotide-binding domain-containing protein [Methylobacter sp.]